MLVYFASKHFLKTQTCNLGSTETHLDKLKLAKPWNSWVKFAIGDVSSLAWTMKEHLWWKTLSGTERKSILRQLVFLQRFPATDDVTGLLLFICWGRLVLLYFDHLIIHSLCLNNFSGGFFLCLDSNENLEMERKSQQSEKTNKMLIFFSENIDLISCCLNLF